MRVDVQPQRLSIVPGQPAVVRVSISNTGTVISGHRIRTLGVDPAWARVDTDELSLFPDTSGVAVVTITLPTGLPAGTRTLGVEVTELTSPRESVVIDVEVTIPAELGLKLALDPVSVTGGGSQAVAVLLDNTGNAPLEVHLEGADEERAISFAFSPPEPELAQGDQLIGKVTLKARRPWFGTPKVRSYTVRAGPPRAPVIAVGAWVQKARLSRGMMALVGLLAAATVFAVVLTASLSQVVGNSNADRDLAIQVAEAAQNPAGGASGADAASLTGNVALLTSGKPVPGVTVDVFNASNLTSPIVSTATTAGGTYSLTGLSPGAYKVEFQGAGFSQLWYPDSLTGPNAGVVNLRRGATTKDISIRLGGLPASVSGQVVGADANGATLTLEVPPRSLTATAGPASGAGSDGASTAGGVPTGTVVTKQTLGNSGDFALGDIPSPALYQLVVTKTGYAPAVQEVDLAGGENRKGLVITLHHGDGSIAGTVSGPGGPLAGATVSASDGSTTVSTVSVSTAGSVGTFVLNGLPTPGNFTLLVSANGFASQTLAQSLAPNQHLTGVAVSLTPGAGSISGTVFAGPNPSLAAAPGTPPEAPTGGVTVTATDGKKTETTVTLSAGAVGTYTLTDLPVPGTYTVTFSRPDLASQTQALSLSATGPSNLSSIDADMVAKTATIFGTVTQTGGKGVGEAAVKLTSGKTTYRVTTASVPTAGSYEIDGVAPGTYTISFTRTGGTPTSSIVTLTAGQRLENNPVLNPAASIFGHVVQSGKASQAVRGVAVTLYLASQYPTVVSTRVLTDTAGNFTFANVDAPQNYIVAFAYPQGSSNQETVAVSTTLGIATPVCGSEATGISTPTTTAPQTPASSAPPASPPTTRTSTPTSGPSITPASTTTSSPTTATPTTVNTTTTSTTTTSTTTTTTVGAPALTGAVHRASEMPTLVVSMAASAANACVPTTDPIQVSTS